MRSALWLVACAACSQTSEPLPPASNGALASVVAIEPTTGSQSIPITPTAQGDRLYVLLIGNNGGYVHDMSAGDTRVYLAMAGLVVGDCEGSHWAWSWISSSVSAGTSSIAISADAGASYAGYAMVFSGLSPDIGLVLGRTEDFASGSGGDASAPPLPAGPGNIMLSAVGTCGAAQPELVSSSGFTGMPPVNGVALAYSITEGPRQAGATWHVDGPHWGAHSLVLH
jgi:hypothetical protein